MMLVRLVAAGDSKNPDHDSNAKSVWVVSRGREPSLDLATMLAHEDLQEPAMKNPGLAPGFFMRAALARMERQDKQEP
jgi:hypothetical protein